MKNFLILGNNTALSLAEILSFFKNAQNGKLLNKDVFIFDGDLNPSVIKNLGGVIKIGQVLKEINILKKQDLGRIILSFFDKEKIKNKFKFGMSNYTQIKIDEKRLAMFLKKELKKQGIASRWVSGKSKHLSSVIVEENFLKNKNGAEFVLLQDKNKILLAQTIAVQDFKNLSKRDYGRPKRDDYSGMIPPKLAQIMINLSGAKKNETILDPFCGSGTIVNEAVLAGYKNIFASDISKKAIKDAQENLKYLVKNFGVKNDFKVRFFTVGAEKISQEIKKNSVQAIVSEPFLGPQRGKLEIQKVLKDLNALYSSALSEFFRILKRGGRVVMVWPVFVFGRKKYFLEPNYQKFQKVKLIPDKFLNKKSVQLSKRMFPVYGRSGQRVWREIVVLEK